MKSTFYQKLIKKFDDLVMEIIRKLVRFHTRLVLEQHISKADLIPLNIEELLLDGEHKDVAKNGIFNDK
jgi:hypothetical protein